MKRLNKKGITPRMRKGSEWCNDNVRGKKTFINKKS